MLIMSPAWQDWLLTNISRGCSTTSMVRVMVDAGFAEDYAAQALDQLSAGKEKPGGIVAAADQYLYDPSPIAAGNTIYAYDRDITVSMRCERPEIIIFDNVLSAEECTEIIERSREKLERSNTVDPETGGDLITPDRTSESTGLESLDDPFVERLEHRIAALMNWPLENGEGLQVLRYGIGAEYKPHFDYFAPESKGSKQHLTPRGQRVSTLIMYLNDVPAGGETIFPDARISVSARQGSAVYFRYMNRLRQLNPLTYHGGAPVVSGEKWIMTKWMRESGNAV